MSNSEIEAKCIAMSEGYAALAAKNKLESSEMLLAGAGLFLAAGRTPDAAHLAECRKLLKSRAGVFSNFRGFAEFLVCCKMALAKDPEEYFDALSASYDALKSFWSGSQTVLAATCLADQARGDVAELAEKTKAIYQEMKKAHPWLTSEADLPFAALMAATGKDGSAVYAEAEACYKLLKGQISAGSDVTQMLCHILSLRKGEAQTKCDKVAALAKGLKAAKHGLNWNSQLAILGVLADSELSADELIQLICETDDCLKHYKPFRGLFGVDAGSRRMYAVQIVQSVTSGDASTDVSAMAAASVELAVMIMIYMMIVSASVGASANSMHS